VRTNNVRTYEGIPPLVAFGGSDGTPIVIDVLSGVAYYTYNNLVLPIVGGVLVVYDAFSDGFSDGFTNGS
jgi:hypothetical protein